MLRALIDVQAPYHSFAAKLYKHAAEPASPLPELLWLYSMGIVLYWVHDTSPGARRPTGSST